MTILIHLRRASPGLPLVLLGMLLLLAGCSGPDVAGPGLAPVRVAVGGQAQFVYLPLTLADRLGYFADEGLEVEISDLRGGSQALAALTGGSVDAVVGFYEHTIRAQARGRDLVMVVLYDRFPGLVLMVGADHVDAVRSIADLVGHPVGVTAPGSSSDAMVKFLLRKHGFDPQAIPAVTTGTSTMVAAIETDQVRAGVTVDPLAQKMERDGSARALYDTRTEEGTIEVFGGPWPAGGLYVTTDFAGRRPDTVEALVRASVRALDYIASHPPGEIAEHVPDFWVEADRDLYVEALRANLDMFSRDGAVPEEGARNVLDTLTLVDPEIDPASIDVGRTYDNTWVERARSPR